MRHLDPALLIVEHVAARVRRGFDSWPCPPEARELAGRIVASSILAGVQGDEHHLARLGDVALAHGSRRVLLVRRIALAQQRGAPGSPAAMHLLESDLTALSGRLARLDRPTVAGVLTQDAPIRAAVKLLRASQAFGVQRRSSAKKDEDAEVELLHTRCKRGVHFDDALLLQLLAFWRLGVVGTAIEVRFLLKALEPQLKLLYPQPLPLDQRLLCDVQSKLTPLSEPIADELPLVCAMATGLAVTNDRKRLERLYDAAHTVQERRRLDVAFTAAHMGRFVTADANQQQIAALDLRADLTGVEPQHARLSSAQVFDAMRRTQRMKPARTAAAVALRAGTLDAPKRRRGERGRDREARFAERLRRDCEKR